MTNSLKCIEMELKRELEITLHQEELLWYQKSKSEWIKWGDKNMAHFHLKAIRKRKRNKVEMLKDKNGGWIDDPVELK